MNYIEFFQTAMELKNVSRTGWVLRDVPNPESVSEHSYGVATLALTIPLPANVNRGKLIQMALVHDMAESLIGDLISEGISYATISVTDKKVKKEKAARQLFKDQPKLLELFLEYESKESPEAKLCKELDKLEMVFQAFAYESKLGAIEPFNEFWENAEKYIQTPEILKIYTELKEKRSKG